MPSTDLGAMFLVKLQRVFTTGAFGIQSNHSGNELTATIYWGGKRHNRTVFIVPNDILATVANMDSVVKLLREDVKFDLSLQRFDAAGRRPSGRRRHSDEMMRVTDYADAIST